MDYLLDTHLLLWALADSEKLPNQVRQLLLNPKNQFYYSVASMWEVSIKNETPLCDRPRRAEYPTPRQAPWQN